MSKIDSVMIEKLVHVNRVTKVVKGGRIFSFAAIVVVGDQQGRVGYGTGKAKEVAEARAKAVKAAENNMINVDLCDGRTIYHDIYGSSGASYVLLKKANAGKGVIAGGPLRAVFNCLGVSDIVAKSLRSSNALSMIAATFNALKNISSPKKVAYKRNKRINEIISSKLIGAEML
jgi:small subunit ribosomal protein S5